MKTIRRILEIMAAKRDCCDERRRSAGRAIHVAYRIAFNGCRL